MRKGPHSHSDPVFTGTDAERLLQRAVLTSSNPEFICGKSHVLIFQTITCPITHFPQLSRLLLLRVKFLISSLCRISKWCIIATIIWSVVATACETPGLLGAVGLFVWLFKDRSYCTHTKSSCPATSVLGKCIPCEVLVFSVLLCHLRYAVTERITRYVILYTGLQKPSFLVQEYQTFCGSSFNLLCMTLFVITASTRKTVVISHCLMPIFISGTSTQENKVLTHSNMLSFFSFKLISMLMEFLLLCRAKPLNTSW